MIGFVLLVSLLLNVALRAIVTYAESWVPMPPTLLTVAELVLPLVVITSLFAVIFKVLPDVVVAFGQGAARQTRWIEERQETPVR